MGPAVRSVTAVLVSAHLLAQARVLRVVWLRDVVFVAGMVAIGSSLAVSLEMVVGR